MLGAQLLTLAMQKSGVETIYSLSGNQIMPIYDACLEPGIRIIHTRHESAAVFMADAHAQVSGNVGVAMVTAGPGFANALGGLFSAFRSESPMVFISGDSPVAMDGRRAFQEFPQTRASEPFVKHTERVERAEDLAAAWFKCHDIAVGGRPGPVHLCLPFDVLQAETNATPDDQASLDAHTFVADIYSRFDPDPEDVQRVLEILGTTINPLILTGPSMNEYRSRGLHDLLQQKLQAPVICMESPRGLVDPSLGRLKEVLQMSDCILLLGKQPDFTLNFTNPYDMPSAELILVEADPDEFDKSLEVVGSRCTLAINAMPLPLAHMLTMLDSSAPARTEWLEGVELLLNAASEEYPAIEAQFADAKNVDQGPLHPALVVRAVHMAMQKCPEAILVCDGGEFGQWAQAFAGTACRVINGTSGAIGGGLPQAIAASIARPEATVFTLMGDGTVGFHLAEFETSVRSKAPIITLIGNDSCWNAEHQIQLRDYGEDRTHSCELGTDIRYDKVAEALGGAGEFVKTIDELNSALAAAVTRSTNERQMTCINVAIRGLPAPSFQPVAVDSK